MAELLGEYLVENEIKVCRIGHDGKTDIELYQEKKPDYILINILMKNGSGFYAIKKIKS